MKITITYSIAGRYSPLTKSATIDVQFKDSFEFLIRAIALAEECKKEDVCILLIVNKL